MKTKNTLLDAFQDYVFMTFVKSDPSAMLRTSLAKAKKVIAAILFGLCLLGLNACIKSFDYQPDIYEQILVVEGNITDEEEAHQVILSYTRPVDNTSTSTQIEDATVYVQLGSGQQEKYSHRESGIYVPDENFKAVEGETYQLVIELADRSIVTSDVVGLIPSPPMDSIYGREIVNPSEELNRNEVGAQFFIDSKDPSGKAKYFRYEWDATYVIQVPYTSYYELEGPNNGIVERDENVGTCYINDTSSQLIIATSTTNATNRLAEAPIHFVSSETDQLRTRYSIKVRQFAIDERAFLYYKKLKEANESAGSLFDVQQGSVIGNLAYSENSKIPVLGYFEVAGVSELRRYFRVKDIPDFKLPSFRFPCSAFDIIVSPIDSVAIYLDGSDLLIHNIGELPIEYLLVKRGCASCTWYASNEKPEWWIQ